VKKYYGGIFFITLATLAFEVAIIRYFSIALWSNYGYMVISIALLGFGVSGTLLTIIKDWVEKRINLLMYIISLSVVPVSIGAYILMKYVPFNALQIIDPNYTFKQMGNLALYFVILFFPFFLKGLYIGIAYIAHKKEIQKLYFFDLFGAGVGTVVLLALMFIIHPAYLVIPIIVVLFTGHLLTINYKENKKSKSIKILISSCVFVISMFIISFNASIEYSPQKDIRHTMSSINAKVLAQDFSPLGLLKIVKSTKERSAPGLSGMSYQMTGDMPDFLGVYMDGDQSSSIVSQLGANNIDFIRYLPQYAPFLIKDRSKVLILGLGGGRSLSVAYHSAIAKEFQEAIKEIYFKNSLKNKIDELKKTYRNPPSNIFKQLLAANKERLEKEVEADFKKIMADDTNRNKLLAPYLEEAYELALKKSEGVGPRLIDSVELNGQIIRLLSVKTKSFNGPKFNGGLLYKRGITTYKSDVRGFLRRASKKYDIVEMSLSLGGGMSTSGNLPSHENYLYTTHSIKDAYSVLAENGVLSMTVDAKENLRDALKLFTTAVKALENQNDLGKKFFIFRTMTTVTFLIKKGNFTADEINTLKKFCDDNSFDPCYFDGINAEGNRELNNQEYSSPGENDNNNILKYSLYKISLAKFVKNTYREFIDNYPYNISAVTDNKPYFAYKLKLSQALKALFTGNYSMVPYQETNYLVLWINLAISIIFAILVIALPLLKTLFNPSKRKAWQGGKMKMVGYFVCLGFGFLFVEMVLIQKFVLFLTNPIYSTSLMLAGILIFSGLGSFYSSRLVKKLGDTKKVLLLSVSTIAAVVFVYIFALDPIIRLLMPLPMFIKVLISVIFIAPVSFFLGIPFPMGLSEVANKREDFLPWAWGINGATSVVSTVLATILSISLGFKGVWIIAVIIYLSAYFLFPGRLSKEK
jgi:hypothetical protein